MNTLKSVMAKYEQKLSETDYSLLLFYISSIEAFNNQKSRSIGVRLLTNYFEYVTAVALSSTEDYSSAAAEVEKALDFNLESIVIKSFNAVNRAAFTNHPSLSTILKLSKKDQIGQFTTVINDSIKTLETHIPFLEAVQIESSLNTTEIIDDQILIQSQDLLTEVTQSKAFQAALTISQPAVSSPSFTSNGHSHDEIVVPAEYTPEVKEEEIKQNAAKWLESVKNYISKQNSSSAEETLAKLVNVDNSDDQSGATIKNPLEYFIKQEVREVLTLTQQFNILLALHKFKELTNIKSEHKPSSVELFILPHSAKQLLEYAKASTYRTIESFQEGVTSLNYLFRELDKRISNLKQATDEYEQAKGAKGDGASTELNHTIGRKQQATELVYTTMIPYLTLLADLKEAYNWMESSRIVSGEKPIHIDLKSPDSETTQIQARNKILRPDVARKF